MPPTLSLTEQRARTLLPAMTSWRLSAGIRLVTGLLIGLYVVSYMPPSGIGEPRFLVPAGLLGSAILVAPGLVHRGVGNRPSLVPTWFAVDVLAPIGFIWLFAFDPSPSVFVLAFIGVTQGAPSLGLRGGVMAWARISLAYVGYEAAAVALSGQAASAVLVAMRVIAAMFVGLLVGRTAEMMFESERQREVAEGELALTEDSLRTLFEASPVALVVTDRAGIVEAWSSPTAELWLPERASEFGRAEGSPQAGPAVR